MKVAVASEGEAEDSAVSRVGGRAPYYLIFEDGKFVKAIKNPFIMGGGAGVSMAQVLSNEHVEVVISGKFGPSMKMWLAEKGIKMVEVTERMTVKEAIKSVKYAKATEIS